LNNFDLEKTLSTMVCIIDSREKPTDEAKKRWESFGIPYVIEPLKSADYTAKFRLPNGEWFSLENVVLIERKASLTEICGNFCQNRKRFIREFERIKTARAKVYILIENGTWEKAYSGQYRSQMQPQALIASLTAWMARYNANILFCKPETTPKLIREILYREAKEYFEMLVIDDELL
jgi:ERCC4-type nuclease